MKKTVKLNQNHLFRRLYRVGKNHVTPYFAVYIKKNRLGYNRLGITATKKIGGAVQRNRARRLISEAYRLLESELPAGYDIVIVARKKSVFAKMQSIRDSLRACLQQKNAVSGGFVPNRGGSGDKGKKEDGAALFGIRK